MTRPDPERLVLLGIINVLGRRPDVRLWRNNVGAARGPDGRVIRFGLPGSSDILGILKPGGWFLAIEAKSATGHLTDEQAAFLDVIRGFGGCALVARSVDEAVAGVNEFLASHVHQPEGSHAQGTRP